MKLRNYWLCIAIFLIHIFAVLVATEIKIELEDVAFVQDKDSSTSVATVQKNQPFGVNIIIKNVQKQPQNISIAGLDTVQVIQQHQSNSMQTINGVTESITTYHVMVRAPNEGPVTIGPAQMEIDGGLIKSDPVTVMVRKESTRAPVKGQASVLCKISLDAQEVVVGQQMPLKMALYTHGPILDIGIGSPTFDGFSVKETNLKSTREEVVDGIPYRVNEITYMLTPLQEGKKILNPITVQYLTPSQKKRSSMHGQFGFGTVFDSFFGPQSDQKQVSSNELMVDVLPLPQHKGQVHGIGDFTAFTASIDKQEADLNEPLTLSLSIQGQGNFDQIAIPKLTLPKWFKSYESKTENGDNKKRFDFIVQVSTPGSVTIPPQSFTYFDVTSKTYKTLKTDQLTIQINKPENYQVPSSSPQAPQEAFQSENSEQEAAQKYEIRPQGNDNNFSLPWWIFLIILFLPLLIFSKKIIQLYHVLTNRFFGARIHARALGRFERDLDLVCQKGDAPALYQFFLRFFAVKSRVTIDQVTEDWIEGYLQRAGWTTEKITEYLDFLSACAQLHFTRTKHSASDQSGLLKKSKYWFIMLNK